MHALVLIYKCVEQSYIVFQLFSNVSVDMETVQQALYKFSLALEQCVAMFQS